MSDKPTPDQQRAALQETITEFIEIASAKAYEGAVEALVIVAICSDIPPFQLIAFGPSNAHALLGKITAAQHRLASTILKRSAEYNLGEESDAGS